MKILLINVRNYDFGRILQCCYPPFGLLYIGGALLRAGYCVKVLDANALRLSDDEILKRAIIFKPDLIGLAAFSDILNQVYGLLEKLKVAFPGSKFVLGGADVNAHPKKVLEDFEDVDFVLQGECERSIVQLCSAIEGSLKFEEVPGLFYRKDNKIVCNNLELHPVDLNELDFPAKELVKEAYLKKRYYTLFVKERPVDGIITSRGCPYRCKFCHNFYREYRASSPERVIEEIYELYVQGRRFIRIYDDNFTLDRFRAMRIFELLRREKFPLRFEIKSRADMVDEELLKKAKEVGVCQISYGMESADQDMLDRMQKGIKVSDIVNAIEITKRMRIRCHTSWLFGFPGETIESIQKTADLIIKLKPTSANLLILRPYPQTPVYLEAKDNGSLEGDWSVKNQNIPWVKLPWVRNREELEGLLTQAVRKIYFRPFYFKEYCIDMIRDLNPIMIRYALQEMGHCISQLISKRI